jgi:hypothetical protein
VRGGGVILVTLTDEQRASLLGEIDSSIAALRRLRGEIARRRTCTCESCSKSFDGRAGAKACSDACRQSLYRARHRIA